MIADLDQYRATGLSTLQPGTFFWKASRQDATPALSLVASTEGDDSSGCIVEFSEDGPLVRQYRRANVKVEVLVRPTNKILLELPDTFQSTSDQEKPGAIIFATEGPFLVLLRGDRSGGYDRQFLRMSDWSVSDDYPQGKLTVTDSWRLLTLDALGAKDTVVSSGW